VVAPCGGSRRQSGARRAWGESSSPGAATERPANEAALFPPVRPPGRSKAPATVARRRGSGPCFQPSRSMGPQFKEVSPQLPVRSVTRAPLVHAARPRRPPAQPRRSCCAVPAALLCGLGALLRGPRDPPAHPFWCPTVRYRGSCAAPATLLRTHFGVLPYEHVAPAQPRRPPAQPRRPPSRPVGCPALPWLDACAWPSPLLRSSGVRLRGASVSLRPCACELATKTSVSCSPVTRSLGGADSLIERPPLCSEGR
jgi:hypothetical protein